MSVVKPKLGALYRLNGQAAKSYGLYGLLRCVEGGDAHHSVFTSSNKKRWVIAHASLRQVKP